MRWTRQGVMWLAELPLGGWLVLGPGTMVSPPDEAQGDTDGTTWARMYQTSRSDWPHQGWWVIPGTVSHWTNAVQSAGGLIPDSMAVHYWRALALDLLARGADQGPRDPVAEEDW